MEIRTQAFCGIARSKDWQQWLKVVASDLHTELIEALKINKGCRANNERMQNIYLNLYKRGLEHDFETFMRRRFPWLVKNNNPVDTKKIEKNRKPIVAHKKIMAPHNHQDHAKLNKHGVFASYKPHLLTFPQKLIITGDKLFERVQEFCKDKLAIDYIIIDDHAYIEYFNAQYASVVPKYLHTKREIYKYRQKTQNA